MRKIPTTRYRSADEIEREIRQKQSMADALPGGDSKRKLLIEVAQLKTTPRLTAGLMQNQRPDTCDDFATK